MEMCRLIHVDYFKFVKQAEYTMRLVEIIVYYRSESAG